MAEGGGVGVGQVSAAFGAVVAVFGFAGEIETATAAEGVVVDAGAAHAAPQQRDAEDQGEDEAEPEHGGAE